MDFAVSLAKLKRYLKHYPADAPAIAQLLAQGRSLGWPVLSPRGLEQIFLAVHRRRPDARELGFYLEQVDRLRLGPHQVLMSFLMMPAGLERHLYGSTITDAHHLARLKLIKHLPPARRIVDLGGACIQDPRGSLLYMGYAPEPEQIDILDLAPDERIWHRPEHRHADELRAGRTLIRYHYRPLWDLAPFADASTDLVWSGQSIEHVSQDQARQAIAEAWRILAPRGMLCLDTPNRALTQLLVHEDFVHPEHKIEYRVGELSAMLREAGFTIEQALAVSPMPFSLASSRFSRLELLAATGLGPDPETGFSFYLACRKPG